MRAMPGAQLTTLVNDESCSTDSMFIRWNLRLVQSEFEGARSRLLFMQERLAFVEYDW